MEIGYPIIKYIHTKFRKYYKHLVLCATDGLDYIKNNGISTGVYASFNSTMDSCLGTPPKQEINFKQNINILFNNLIELINDGEYKRFNVIDFYNKSFKINNVIDSIIELKLYHNRNIMGLSNIYLIFSNIKNSYPFLDNSIKKLSELIANDKIQSKEMIFIEIRNLIASEWKYRNILNNPNLKDLNYLKYNIEEYHEYLHNCLNFLIRDTKKFISRYPLEYKNNPDLDIEIILALRNSIFNDIIPRRGDDKIIDFYNICEDLNKSIPKTIIVRGWYKDKLKTNFIKPLKYKEYRRSKNLL